MSYEVEHLGLWHSTNFAVSSSVQPITFTDGNNTFTTPITNYKWNIVEVHYEFVSAAGGSMIIIEAGGGGNTFFQAGGAGSIGTAGWRSVKLSSRGITAANAGRGINVNIAGSLLANFIIAATMEKVS